MKHQVIRLSAAFLVLFALSNLDVTAQTAKLPPALAGTIPTRPTGRIAFIRDGDLWVMDADGSHKRQITDNTGANFAPFMHPDGEHIIFSSNMADTSRVPMNFDLYMVGTDGTGLQRITFSEYFDGFPMFSPDGKSLVFASGRGGKKPWEINIFIADWKQ